ncbi:hypothetical protein EMPS_05148 [Entomortierella parvispora]|uniref:VTT domain-containing protein n=1 Tax=Entomortierella parvispora TaxID=205924 RepID=A0A9P3LWG4_9FUNG|nr:hypothetical protein EMPS_05148 [Entomortierella parvispora]
MAKKKSKSNNSSKSRASGQTAASAVQPKPDPKVEETPAAQPADNNAKAMESAPVQSSPGQTEPDFEVNQQSRVNSALQDDLRIDDSQSPWALIDTELGVGQNGKADDAPKHGDEFLVETRNAPQESGSRASLEEFRPFSERAPPRRYEDDDDDYEHYHNEQAPLIRTGSNDGHYNDNRPVPPSSHSTSRRLGGEPPLTWIEWTHKNGLHPRTWTRQTYIKAGLLATLLTLIILSFTVFRVQDHIKDILRYIDQHKRIGAVLFVVSYTVACTLFLPGSLFTIGAGFLFKPFPLALLIVLLGDVFAAVGSFIFGRYVFYDWVKGMMSKHPKFGALDQVIKDDGWKIVVMLRLTPIPFNLITYFFSITSIRLWTVVWATCVGVLPGSCIGIWIGSLLKGLSGIDNPELETKNVVILVMNGIFIVCCILTLSLFGKRSLRKAMKRLDQHQALTSMHEVEVVIEGVATVVREIEDRVSIPPSFRSTMIEQLAEEEETDQDFYYRGDIESAQQRLLPEETQGEEGGSSSSTIAGLEGTHQGIHHPGRKPRGHGSTAAASTGFTKGEKWTFVIIAVVGVLNVCVCVPLYYHFAGQGN